MKKILLVVIPVFNEEYKVKQNVPVLYNFLANNLNVYEWQIVIANNGSIDRTLQVAQEIAHTNPQVKVIDYNERGKGGVLQKVFSEYPADIYCYMDVDLSTGLDKFPDLINSVTTGGYDIAIGSRLLPGSQVSRSWGRKYISQGYNILVRTIFPTTISDFQCGFKAFSNKIKDNILPLVQDTRFFFDTELLILSDRVGYKIHQLPVTWIENTDTRVNIIKTIFNCVFGLARLKFQTMRKVDFGEFNEKRTEKPVY